MSSNIVGVILKYLLKEGHLHLGVLATMQYTVHTEASCRLWVRAGQPSMTSSFSLSQIQCQGKHVIHFSLYLNLKYKVKVSNFRGVPLATDNKIVVRHSLYTPTLNSATFQPSIANSSVCSSMLPQPFRSNGKHSGANPACRHSSASHSAALDRVRR